MTAAVTRILVPVDFSPHSERAVQYAATLADRLGASLKLIHVVEDPYASGAWSSEVFTPNIPELLDTLIADSRRRLAALKEVLVRDGQRAEIEVIKGNSADSIVEHAKEGRFDLIVMGTHGRRGVAHAILGSVAERVVRTAGCPVLTVRDTETKPAETVAAAARTIVV
jgi:glycine betaine transporter